MFGLKKWYFGLFRKSERGTCFPEPMIIAVGFSLQNFPQSSSKGLRAEILTLKPSHLTSMFRILTKLGIVDKIKPYPTLT